MGRPGLTQNKKFRRLALVLESPALARGHLELLWDSAYEAGDEEVGDAVDVALACSWKGDPGFIADALTTTGFLDDSFGQYTIHDFWHHAPAYVRKRRTRENERRTKSDPVSSVTSQGPVTDEKTAPLPHPHPHPHLKEKEQAAAPPAPVPLVTKKQKQPPKVRVTALKEGSFEDFQNAWDCIPPTRRIIDKVVNDWVNEPIPKGSRFQAEKNFQAIVDSGHASSYELYAAMHAYIQEDAQVKKGFYQHVSTFYGPDKATWIQWMERARQLVREAQ